MKAGRFGKFRGLFLSALVVLALSLVLAACGGSSDSSSSSSEPATTSEGGGGSETGESEEGGNVSINVGSEEIEVEKGTPKIGFYAYGLSSYELAYKAQLEEMNDEGSDITWLEAKYDAATQLKQLQTAVTSGEYDAIIIESVDPEGSCRILSEQMPQAGIVVSIIVQPICGKGANVPWGEEVWQEGTLNTVGSNSNVTFFANVLKAQKELLKITPSTKVGVIQGPDISANAQSFETALETAGIKPVEVSAGDYTAPTAQKLTSAMLSRNPDIEVILNGYEGATPGEIAALKEAGKKPGEVKLGDIGGSKEISAPSIESGWLTATAYEDPKQIAKVAIEEVEKAFNGEEVPRTNSADPEGCSLAKPCIITKDNLGQIEPTY